MVNEQTSRACPFCKEDIKQDAIKCKHCGSKVPLTTPSHEGTCPYCKETINPEAIKCKHCHSILISNAETCDDCKKEATDLQFYNILPLEQDTSSLLFAREIESGVDSSTDPNIALSWRWPWSCPSPCYWKRVCIGRKCWSACYCPKQVVSI